MVNIKNIIFGLAIMILTIFASVYGINALYERPQYDDFCTSIRPVALDKTGDSQVCPAVCVELYEIKNNECVFNECGSGCGADGVNTFDTKEQCDIVLSGKNCYDEYDAANRIYARNVFFIGIPLGIVIIVIGASLFSLESVGAGLMLGGAGTLVYGVGGYWQYADNLIKFIISIIGLAALISFAYWFNSKQKGFWSRFFKGKK